MDQRVYQLFLLNLCLQLFDGVATYQGLQFHWTEGNPIILRSMTYFGVGSTLLLFKAKACGFLFLLRQHAGHPFVYESLVVLATVYSCLSFVPWLACLVSLL
jgi:hypothetical protein